MNVLSAAINTRFIIKSDFKAIAKINKTSGKYAWKFADIKSELSDRWSLGIVAVDENDGVVGFCVYSLSETDRFVIKHFVVDVSHYRLGVGTCLIDRMKSKMNKKRNLLTYSVPDSNLGIQLFLKKMGFKGNLIRGRIEDFINFSYGG